MTHYETAYAVWNGTHAADALAATETAALRARYAAEYAMLRGNVSLASNVTSLAHDLLSDYYMPRIANATVEPRYSYNISSSMGTSTRATVRQVQLHITLGEHFAQFDDVLQVYEGGSDMRGRIVLTRRGTDAEPRTFNVTVMAQQASGTSCASHTSPMWSSTSSRCA